MSALNPRNDDKRWANDFVRCKIPNSGKRFGETVGVLEQKLTEIRLQEFRLAAHLVACFASGEDPKLAEELRRQWVASHEKMMAPDGS